YEDYTEERLEELYADFERLPQIQNYIKESKQENLAKVFTEVRYPEKDSVVFSKAYMEFAKEQDMM
ncbi:MAG: NADPH-dependent oxidoreductase, partial [Bacteroidales bacterium]|nr:NADPH-dependent oxidoreductase [Bacteroidales bacterium]